MLKKQISDDIESSRKTNLLAASPGCFGGMPAGMPMSTACCPCGPCVGGGNDFRNPVVIAISSVA
eukprot:1995955-Amphidinium_carterae.1